MFLLLLSLSLLISACSSSFYGGIKKEQRRISRITKQKYKELPKEARMYFEGMQYIPGGAFTKGASPQYSATEKDTTLLLPNMWWPVRETVEDFFMSGHEVTNAEYREFVHWVRDSMAMTILAQHDSSWYSNKEKKLLNWEKRADLDYRFRQEILKPIYGEHIYYRWKSGYSSPLIDSLRIAQGDSIIKVDTFKIEYPDPRKFIYTYSHADTLISLPIYPDTLIFFKEFTYSANYPMTKNYFWHSAYNDYPVVGVNWYQANAYCHWRTWQYNKALEENSGKPNNAYLLRLPTENEWELAAIAQIDGRLRENINSRNVYPWKGGLIDEQGKYKANFGMIYDQNGLELKSYADDGSFYPTGIFKENFSRFKVRWGMYTYQGSLYYKKNGFRKGETLYPPNDFVLYHMAGNVAEWTSDVPKQKNMGYEEWENSEIVRLNWPYSAFLITVKQKYFEQNPGVETLIAERNSFYSSKDYIFASFSLANWLHYNPDVKEKLDSYDRFIEVSFEKYKDSFLTEALPRMDSIRMATAVTHDDNLQTAMDKIKQRFDLLFSLDNQSPDKNKSMDSADIKYINRVKESFINVYERPAIELQTTNVYHKNPNPRIVKGGSWADGPAYLLCGSREAFSADSSSSRIGFRVTAKKVDGF